MLYNEPNALFIARIVTTLCDATSIETHICVELVSICGILRYPLISIYFYAIRRHNLNVPYGKPQCFLVNRRTQTSLCVLLLLPCSRKLFPLFRFELFCCTCHHNSYSHIYIYIFTYFCTVIYGKVKFHVISNTYNNTVHVKFKIKPSLFNTMHFLLHIVSVAYTSIFI